MPYADILHNLIRDLGACDSDEELMANEASRDKTLGFGGEGEPNLPVKGKKVMPSQTLETGCPPEGNGLEQFEPGKNVMDDFDTADVPGPRLWLPCSRRQLKCLSRKRGPLYPSPKMQRQTRVTRTSNSSSVIS